MKFSNGCWLQKEGCGCFAPTECYYTKVTDTEVSICAPTSKITNRGATLGGINLTVKITSPKEEILRVQVYHHIGTIKKDPSFDLELNDNLPLDVIESEDVISIKSGTLTLEITKNPFAMTYLRDGKVITKSIGKVLAIMKAYWKDDPYDKAFVRALGRERWCVFVGIK